MTRREAILAAHKANPGKSVSQLAKLIGNGVTRNMVAGLLNRAGLTTGNLNGLQIKQQRDVAMGRIIASKQDPIGCRYIHGHPDQPNWHYCQAKEQPGSSYCTKHHLICYRPVEEPKPQVAEAA